jgi:hypothetical protein
VICEIGTYDYPKQVGYNGWVSFERNIVFVRLDGELDTFKKPIAP